MFWTDNSTNPLSLESPSISNLIQPPDSIFHRKGYANGSNSSTAQTIAFVDANIADPMTVMANFQADVKILLDPTQDGILQITQALSHYQGLTGIDIISHGNAAQVQLGANTLNPNSLDRYADNLQKWNESLAPDADILFYGCNVAAGSAGQAFVNQLSDLTGADIAASTNLTGNAANGGDWLLEYATGKIETATPTTNSALDNYQGVLASIFTTQIPENVSVTDGTGSDGDYELGMEFTSTKAGSIDAIRYYKSPMETGTHTGQIWSSTGMLLGSVNFTNETASGWQQQALDTPINIAANTTYVVSVNANSYFVVTPNGISSTIANGDLSAVADGSNGVVNSTPGLFPTLSYNNTNYFRDVVFTPSTTTTNQPGTISVSGTTTQNQVLTANVADADGLTGVTLNYKWQQSADNGTTWSDIAGATNQTLTLGQAQVNNRVRATATYTDALGTAESLLGTATALVTNVNDLGTISISGTNIQNQVLTATVADLDGLTGVTLNYNWQQSADNGTTWSNIAGATSKTLTLGQAQVNNRVRATATYTDALGTAESPLSPATSVFASSNPTSASIFTTQTPDNLNITDGAGSAGDYELGMEFTSAKSGQINAIRYYKSPTETGTHLGSIWSNTGTLLGRIAFTNETASGWQQQSLTTPVNIAANTTYVVSVNANSYFVTTANGISTTITNGDLSAVADGSNGVVDSTPGLFPTLSYNNTNYFRDVVFCPTAVTPNKPGAITVSGSVRQNQTLTANVADADGLTGVTVKYQWQQSADNGTTWRNIDGATSKTLILGQSQVKQRVRATATYTDALGTAESPLSAATVAVVNVNDVGKVILKGSATVGRTLTETVLDDDGLTGSNISYRWQQSNNGTSWTNISGATNKSLTLTSGLLGKQVRVRTNYVDALGTGETIFSAGTSITAQNAIVLENQKTGTVNWQIDPAVVATNEIAGYGDATSINKGQALNLKISLAQAGQYNLEVYRLGYYGGAGGRLITSASGLNGVNQAGPTIDPNTRLVEYKWNTSYTLQTATTWTSGLYLVKLTDSLTGKQNYVEFTLRDDNRPAELGFQEAVTTTAAYNNYGGYSTYAYNSINNQPAYQVSFDRPTSFTASSSLTYEYNMARWLESQGYDITYYSNLDVHTNPLQLYSQNAFLSVGHDEYWSLEMRNNVEKARDNGTNLGFFSANTAYWRTRFEPSSSGAANRIMTVYKNDWNLDPVAQQDNSKATTLFRSPQVNRPENALLGVLYTGQTNDFAGGFDFVVSNAADPYYAGTGLQNGDKIPRLVGYEWDAVVNNGATPAGLVVLGASPVTPTGVSQTLPPGTNTNISNAVRYTAASGAKVFSTGSIQWAWGLDSDRAPNPRRSTAAQRITANVLADFGAKAQTPQIFPSDPALPLAAPTSRNINSSTPLTASSNNLFPRIPTFSPSEDE
jgi:hypothetical protein